MNSRTVWTLLTISFSTAVSLAADDSSPTPPTLLARLDEERAPQRLLFLYSPDELRSVHVWLKGEWKAAGKVRDASDEEPYYAYQVSQQLKAENGQKILLNSWSADGQFTYRHELELKESSDDFRVSVSSLSVRDAEQYRSDQAKERTESTDDQIPEAPGFVEVSAESRALIDAVRETGAQSVQGTLDPELLEMAQQYAQRMANQQRQDGHAGFEQRFQYLTRAGSGGSSASEITAESWSFLSPELAEHARSCVKSWLQSPGHRADMMRFHGRYGYAMARGDNGVYYAVGIFVN